MSYIMQIVWLPPGNVSYIILVQIIQIIQIRDLSALYGRSRSSTVLYWE